MWDELERRVRQNKFRPKNKAALFAALKREWDQIQSDVIVKLVDSMPRRVKAVLKSKGGATPY